VAEHPRTPDEWLAKHLMALTPEVREVLTRAAEILGRIGRST
jgi:hypothetical protein